MLSYYCHSWSVSACCAEQNVQLLLVLMPLLLCSIAGLPPLSSCSAPPLPVTQRGAHTTAAAADTTTATVLSSSSACHAEGGRQPPPLPLCSIAGISCHHCARLLCLSPREGHTTTAAATDVAFQALISLPRVRTIISPPPLLLVPPPFFLSSFRCFDHHTCASSAAGKLVPVRPLGPAGHSLDLGWHSPPCKVFAPF